MPPRKDDVTGKMGYFTSCAFRNGNLTIFPLSWVAPHLRWSQERFFHRHREACKAVAIQGGKATEELSCFVGLCLLARTLFSPSSRSLQGCGDPRWQGNRGIGLLRRPMPPRKDDVTGKMGYFTSCAFRNGNLTIFPLSWVAPHLWWSQRRFFTPSSRDLQGRGDPAIMVA